jgi:hypothetical protein
MNNFINNTFLIDFDEASREWRKNKRYLGNGCFEYKCSHLDSKGKYCKNKVIREGLCKYHIK